jgi:hypothetical protein
MTRSFIEQTLIAVALAQAVIEVEILGRRKRPKLLDPRLPRSRQYPTPKNHRPSAVSPLNALI